MGYTKTAIQVLAAAGSAYHGNFLFVGPAQDTTTFLVPNQGDASLFNIPDTPFDFVEGFQVTGGPDGVRVAFTDLLAHEQPLLWATQDQLDNESAADTVGCNTFPDADGVKNIAGCRISDNARFVYGSGWAVCTAVGHNPRLFIYDTDFHKDGPPMGCEAVDLLVVAAPSS